MSDAAGEVGALIVGAGPVGLALACELRRHGMDCRIIDAGEGPTPPEQSRALGIQARTLEVFEDLGVVGPILEAGRKVRAANLYKRGRPFARLELDLEHLGTPYPFILILSQGETERALLDRLAGHGGAVDWRAELKDLRQDDRGVTATLGGQERPIRARWLIGCDGAHSVVRYRLGLPFEGAVYEERFLLADARVDWDLDPDEAQILTTLEGVFPAIPLPEPGHWRLIDTSGAVDSTDPARIADRFRSALRLAGFPAARVRDPAWTSSFRIHRRVVDRFRLGRCFLAGDSAHIHSPAGGQGMNTGIQDASNLAWKLAMVDAGTAPESLLDSYDLERRPVAEAVLKGTDRATRLVTLRNPLARWARDRLVANLSPLGPFRRQLSEGVSELALNYRDSPLSAEDWSGKPQEPRPGDRVPDLALDAPEGGPGRLFDLLRGTRWTLLLIGGNESESGSAVADLINARYSDRIDLHRLGGRPGPEAVGVRLHRRFEARSPSLYLIRPDGHVGYRATPPDAGRLDFYLKRILG
ncbi:FAD-dependent monooxygenase [soil metagenome]